MRVNKGQEFVIGGYIPASENFAAILVGYYEGKDLIYAAKVRTDSYQRLEKDYSSAFADLNVQAAHSRTYPKPREDDGVKG